MAMECEPSQELIDVIFCCKTLSDDKTECIICLHDETAEGHQWDRYRMPCGHKYHTRCLRRWCYYKQSVNCPLCADVNKDGVNTRCIICGQSGHNGLHDGCPTVEAEIKKSLTTQRRRQLNVPLIKAN